MNKKQKLNLRADKVKIMLESLSKDSRYIHDCETNRIIINNVRQLVDKNKTDLDHYKSVIIRAEKYMIRIAKKS